MDHNPIELKIQIKVPQPPPKIISKINYTQLQIIINNTPILLPEINNTNDIDHSLELLLTK